MPGTELFGEEERKEVNDVMETGVLFRYGHDAQRNGHWKAKEFEAEVAQFTGAKYAHGVANGTAAITCALAAAGIGYGDEVICTPFTFMATNEAVMFLGAIPLFAEVDESLCLSPEGIEAVVTPNTKAVCLVHMCGAAARLDEIKAVCERHNLILVEDAGQALGAFYKGKHVGLHGVAGAFSFDFFKLATCGEGGIFITDDEETYKKADTYSDHGHTHIGDNRGMEQHPYLGLNYRLGELNAAIGLAQMRKVPNMIETQRRNKAILKDALNTIPELTFRHLSDEAGDSCTFLNFFMPSKEGAKNAADELGKAGIGAAYWYTNMYHFINQWDHVHNLSTVSKLPVNVLPKPQDYANLDLPKSQDVIGRLISIGVSAKKETSEIEAMANQLAEIVRKHV
ncbi:MAG: L-glutamine--2-deoxy-scyllo-inosose aminotransferase KanB [Crocinitomicaceae bacterium]|nr:L-glutamine--2-deoxy-scyllo-inosose aminotransferase KanB [Crocinitomicaceae bacterium]|tara:strand:+ start:8802 stop:9992 length:1191 start_codon:yes stop_codon:yes gene_type:complete